MFNRRILQRYTLGELLQAFVNATWIILKNGNNTNTPCQKDWIKLTVLTFAEMWSSFLSFS